MSGVCIGVVAVGPPTWSFVGSLIKLQKPGKWTYRRVGPLAVDVARNRLVREFLKSTDDKLLMVDADAVLHPATLSRLLSWQQPIVSALAFSRYGPMFPTVYRGRPANGAAGHIIQLDAVREWLRAHPDLISSEPVVLASNSREALFQVDRTGCHCVLIDRSVFEAVAAASPPGEPWFKAREDGGSAAAESGAGEDFYFFEQVEKAGIPAYVDLGCMAGHAYGERTLAGQDFLVWDYASEYGANQQEG